jgi:Ser/Thr protein kinase RdoA (MazF antagonist)
VDDAGEGLRGLRAAPTAELTQALLRRYGIEVGQSRDLGGSSNLNLLVFDGAARYVVRVYRPSVTAGRLAAIHHVRYELDRAGVPCPRLVATRDGEPWVRVGGRLVEVERYVDHDARMDSWDRLQAGLPMLGRIHTLLQPVEVSAEGRRPLFANYLEPPRARSATARATARIRGWRPTPAEERLARLSDELAELVTAAGGSQAETMPTQLVHGDFWDNNVLFRGGHIVLVTDFDFMGERTRVDDLALTLYFADSSLGHQDDGSRLARLQRLVDAYDSGLGNPLTMAERAALPLAIARQPLWAIGSWLATLDDEKTARDLAAVISADVERALQVVREMDKWQQAFV